MSKIYTRTGDAGETGLFGGPRVRKDDPRVEAYGVIDELNASLGLARAALAQSAAIPAEIDAFLARVQHGLFNLGAELATPQPDRLGPNLIQDAEVAWLESAVDGWDAELEPLREFILPGGALPAAQMHLARCVCRRAERAVVHLAAQQPVRGQLLRYLNRLSDALFVLARTVNRLSGVGEVAWRPTP